MFNAGKRKHAKTKGINRRVMELNPQLSTSKTTGASLSLAVEKTPTMLIPLPLSDKDTTETPKTKFLRKKRAVEN